MKTLFTFLITLLFCPDAWTQPIEGEWYLKGCVTKGGDWEVPFFPDEEVPYVKATFQYGSTSWGDIYYMETAVCGHKMIWTDYALSGDSFLIQEILEEDFSECTNPDNTFFQQIYFNGFMYNKEFNYEIMELENDIRHLILDSGFYHMTFTDTQMSINDFQLKPLQIYPNPTKDFLHFSESLKDIKVYDLSGKLIKTQSNSVEKLNVIDFPKGTYILSGTSESRDKIQLKFVRN